MTFMFKKLGPWVPSQSRADDDLFMTLQRAVYTGRQQPPGCYGRYGTAAPTPERWEFWNSSKVYMQKTVWNWSWDQVFWMMLEWMMDLIPALSSATNQQETFNRPVTQVGLMSTNEAAKRQEEAFVPVTPSVLVAGHPYYITSCIYCFMA